MKRILLVGVSLLLAVLLGCSTGTSNSDPANNTDQTYANVYIAGQAGTSACYWKNETCNVLPTPTGYSSSNATALSFQNSSMYVSGYVTNDSGWNTACIWVDGQYSALSMPMDATDSEAKNIAYFNGSQYIPGYVLTTGQTPCYWKDGTINILYLPSDYIGYAVDITVNGNNVYVAGFCSYQDPQSSSSSYLKPCYWKDGAFVELPLSGQSDVSGAVESCKFINNSFYVSGDTETGSSYSPCYWQDGVYHPLPMSAPYNVRGTAGLIASADNVYIAGYTRNTSQNSPCYWKDGVYHQIPLPDGVTSGIAWAIQVDATNIYTTGAIMVDSVSTPVYWINGTCKIRSLPTGVSSWDDNVMVLN